MVKRKSVWALVVVLALLPSAIALLNETVRIESPANDSSHRLNVSVNTTFNGTANITIDFNFSGAFEALNVSNNNTNISSFNWVTNNGSFPDGVYGLRVTAVNFSNQSDNITLFAPNLIIDNTPPNVTNITFSNNHPANSTVPVNITVNVSDLAGVTTVQISNGSSTVLMSLLSGTTFQGIYRVEMNLSTLGCQNEELCSLTILADDAVNNVNNSENTNDAPSPLFIDSDPPVLLSNSTSNSTPTFGDNVTISALWSDVSLFDTNNFVVQFQVFDPASEIFSSSANFETWDNSQISSNYTNNTYTVNGTDEGRQLTFRVLFTDSNGLSNNTDNLTSSVANITPTLSVTSLSNNSIIDNATDFTLEMIDIGRGINLSSLKVNITSTDINTSINYTSNSSLFNCTETYLNITSNVTCDISIGWLSSNVTMDFNVSDLAGNFETTSHSVFIVGAPDIVNVTINGQTVASATPNDSIVVSFANSSAETTINWSIQTNTAINVTSIYFLNVTNTQVNGSFSSPAGIVYNLTAGKNYVGINLTISQSPVVDDVQMNITANVPLDLPAISGQYSGGLIVSFNVTENGIDITNETRTVDTTLDVLVNATNSTHNVPFSVLFNYTALNGLALRWNASSDAFRMETGTQESNLSNITNSNVTIIISNLGQTELFFDEQIYRVSAKFNLTLDNKTAYYQMRNSTDESTYLLEECLGAPTSPINASDSCYTNSSDSITLFLPRFERFDRIFLAEPGNSTPNVSIATSASINQSVIPLHIQVVTPMPNTTFCSYNLSFFNETTNTTTLSSVSDLASSEFSLNGFVWEYRQNLTGKDDGQYNLTVSCADIQNRTNITKLNIGLTDTSVPQIYDVLHSGVGRDDADVSGRADEFAVFTVYYGTEPDDLTETTTQLGLSLTASIALEDLGQDTTYSYNLTACDAKNQCNTSSTSSFKTLVPSSGSSGGGGVSDSDPISNEKEAVESRVWALVNKDQLIEYDPKGIDISLISMYFIKDVDKVTMTIEQYADKPSALEFPVPSTAYKYFYLQHNGVTGNVDPYKAAFLVPKEWIDNNSIVLNTIKIYRLEEDWTPYSAKISDVGDAYTFTVDLPGFSYFAVAGKSTALPERNESEEPITVQDVEREEPIEEDPSGTFVSALDREDGGVHPAFIILGIVVIVSGLAVLGLQQYKLYQKRQEEHQEELKKEQAEYKHHNLAPQQIVKHVERPPEHDPMAPLHEYIVQMRQKGYDDNHIKHRLQSTGWDSVIVDQELMRE